jgi:anti-sigma-K factor RskA
MTDLPPKDPDDRVPLFGTWRRIHAAVALVALAVMALLALFSRWPF